MSKEKPNGVAVDRTNGSFVSIKSPNDNFKEPLPVHLATGAYVWVPGCESDLDIPGVVIVTDGRSAGFQGDRNIISIPEEWCTFLTEKQANAMAKAPTQGKPEAVA